MSGKSNRVTLDETALRALEKRYQIVFSEYEIMLLTTARDLLAPLDKQSQFLLTQDIAPVQCPACLSTICRRSAAPWAVEGFDYKNSTHGDDDYQCPRCGIRLRYYLLLAGGQGFDVHPDAARPVTS
jgi:DNA-directed RNA polymerase subunit RPC12/RpoP